ncbi:MAG: hypothetical protein ACTSQI_12740 [Candidatus Helarchaeota archaeon]
MTRKCSVMNCQRELKEGEGKVIAGKLYCTECAIFIIKEELFKAGVSRDE